jgi:GT2 family glycosyltransferase
MTAAAELPVSVIVPAFEREVMLARALESVAAQRPARPAEVIVVDDASSDGTAAVAERLGARVLVNDVDRGAAAARNTGVAAASQPWLAMLDSDDEWLPYHLATLWPLRGDHALVAGASIAVSDDDRPPRYHGPLVRGPRVLPSPAALYPENFIPASGVLVRREAVLAAGGYRTDLRYAEDLDLWIRVIDAGSAIVTPRVVVRYGRHEGQKSQVGTRSRDVQRQIVEAYRDRPWWSPRLLERQLAFRGWDALRAALREGDRHAARQEVAGLAKPARAGALAGLLARRWRSRRRSSGLTRSGSPSVAVLPGVADPSTLSADGPVIDLRDAGGTLRAVAQLARRPAGVAMVRTRRQALAVRSVGVPVWRISTGRRAPHHAQEDPRR